MEQTITCPNCGELMTEQVANHEETHVEQECCHACQTVINKEA